LPATDENIEFDSQIVSELGPGANVKLSLYQVTPGSGTAGGWIDDLDPDLARAGEVRRYVRDEYGGGTYFVRMLRDGKFHRQFRFSIVAPRKNLVTPAAPVAAAPAQEGMLERILTRMEENNRRMIEAIERRPQQDPFDMFSKMASLIKETRVDAPAMGAEQLITVFNKGMETAQKQLELARTVASGGGGETGLMDLVKAAIEPGGIGAGILQAVLKQQAETAAPARPPAAVAPAIAALPGRVDPATNGHDPAAVLDANLKLVMQTLVAKAALNADVGLYAEWTHDNLAPELVQMLLNRPNVIDELAAAFPGMGQNRGWFDALLSEMLTIARGQEGTPAVPGNDPNANETGAGS